jgi:hypothetical protein
MEKTMSSQQDVPSLKLLEPISIRIIERKEAKIGDQTETSVQIEMVGANNVKYVSDQLMRSVETDGRISHVTTTLLRKFASKDDSTAAESEVMTNIADITKGEIEGDYRLATVESTLVTVAGILKSAPRQIRMPLKNPYDGRPEQEVAEEIFKKVMDWKSRSMALGEWQKSL